MVLALREQLLDCAPEICEITTLVSWTHLLNATAL